VWIPEDKTRKARGYDVPGALPVVMEREPSEVWTYFGADASESVPPSADPTTFRPVYQHPTTPCFPESAVHDWHWRDGKFYYASRVSPGDNWIFVKWKDEEVEKPTSAWFRKHKGKRVEFRDGSMPRGGVVQDVTRTMVTVGGREFKISAARRARAT